MTIRFVLSAACVTVLLSGTTAAQSLGPQDYAEIQQLYARAAHAFEGAEDKGAAFASAFTPDGVLVDVDGKTYEGRSNLAALAASVNGGRSPGSASEFIYNLLIEPAPEGAVTRSYVVVTRTPQAGQPVMATAAGQYHDSLVKTADGWRIRRREFVRTPNAPASLAR